jgi:hypothetical protein
MPHQARRYDGVPRLSLRVAEAAQALGVSEDFFAAEIAPELAVVRRGRLKLYSVRALEAWLDANAERVLSESTA